MKTKSSTNTAMAIPDHEFRERAEKTRQAMRAAGIDPRQRAEELGVAQWARLAEAAR